MRPLQPDNPSDTPQDHTYPNPHELPQPKTPKQAVSLQHHLQSLAPSSLFTTPLSLKSGPLEAPPNEFRIRIRLTRTATLLTAVSTVASITAPIFATTSFIFAARPAHNEGPDPGAHGADAEGPIRVRVVWIGVGLRFGYHGVNPLGLGGGCLGMLGGMTGWVVR